MKLAAVPKPQLIAHGKAEILTFNENLELGDTSLFELWELEERNSFLVEPNVPADNNAFLALKVSVWQEGLLPETL